MNPPNSSTADSLTVRFEAMHCPCEILLDQPAGRQDTNERSIGADLLDAAVGEAQRIEAKYSRYVSGNIVDAINTSEGKKVKVDDETAALLDFAAECYGLSGGLFDITTGALRKIWRFEGEAVVPPTQAEIAKVRARMGWAKISWKRPFVALPPGFEIDFGGICKEYAADKILELLRRRSPVAALVNLGGDIAAAGERLWSVGIEDVSRPGQMAKTVYLRHGGIATSGATKRFIKIQGEVFGHILNPKTGWPVKGMPASVTVAAKTCTEAGFWSTLGMLQGAAAEEFLKEQSLEFWCYR